MKNLQVEDDLHSDLQFMKGHFRKKNMSDTIRQIMFHAGFTERWFEYIEKMKGDKPE